LPIRPVEGRITMVPVQCDWAELPATVPQITAGSEQRARSTRPGGATPTVLGDGSEWRSGAHGSLVDPAFGDLGELLVGALFLVESLLQQLERLVVTQLLGIGAG
jgi:hypothetical protein